MKQGIIKSIIILPGTVLVFVPTVILLIAMGSDFRHEKVSPDSIQFWVALLAAAIGLIFAFWTVKLF